MNAPASVERQLWQKRGLLWTFVGRDLRARYAGSALGIFWSVIHPLIMLGLYILVFSTIVRGGRFQMEGGPVVGYALFLCPALLAWNWLNESLLGACNSITAHAGLIRKVVFPSGILPAAAIVAGAVPFVVAMAVFLVFAAFAGEFHPITLLLLPPLVLLHLFLMAGPAYLFASGQVFLRDTSQFLTAAFQFLFWGTPIVYPREAVTRSLPLLDLWFQVNPVAHLMEAYRQVILVGRPPHPGSIVYLLAVGVVGYHVGRTVFVRARRHFPDEV